jgi:hypothetical protein
MTELSDRDLVRHFEAGRAAGNDESGAWAVWMLGRREPQSFYDGPTGRWTLTDRVAGGRLPLMVHQEFKAGLDDSLAAACRRVFRIGAGLPALAPDPATTPAPAVAAAPVVAAPPAPRKFSLFRSRHV